MYLEFWTNKLKINKNYNNNNDTVISCHKRTTHFYFTKITFVALCSYVLCGRYKIIKAFFFLFIDGHKFKCQINIVLWTREFKVVGSKVQENKKLSEIRWIDKGLTLLLYSLFYICYQNHDVSQDMWFTVNKSKKKSTPTITRYRKCMFPV